MRRRALAALPWLAAWPVARALEGADPGAGAGPGAARYRISAAQLQQVLARRFPLRYPVANLFDLKVQPPALRFIPDDNRLGARMDVEAGGPALRRRYPGTLDLDFALRYEPRDQTIRAHQIRVQALALADLSAQAMELLNLYLPQLAQRDWAELVLHRLDERELALPGAMGLRPDRILVTADALVVTFSPAQPTPP